MAKAWSISFRYWVLSLLTIILAGSLWFVRGLIGPLVIGTLIAFVLNPTIDALAKHTKLSRSWATSIVLFTGLGGVVAFSALMVPRLISEIQGLFVDLQA
ncbi:MAG: AI-2E family transporter, partial [Anaerolineales bacterium]|nr:AI-2E family transporter [Anaerolineales bacterium]